MRTLNNILFVFIVISLYTLQCAESANILAVFPLAGKGPNILYQRLLKGLADVGHSVTSISCYEFELSIQNGSVYDVLLDGFAEEFEENVLELEDDAVGVESSRFFQNHNDMELLLNIYNRTYHHRNVKRFLMAKPQFDIVITEYLWSDSILGFSKIFKCPAVVFASTGGVNPFVNDMVGNPMPRSYVPHMHLIGDFSNGLSFINRLQNVVMYLYDDIFKYVYSFPAHNEILKTATRLKHNPPDAAELYHNVSLVLLGSHSSIRPATPLVPNVIEIGGFHIDPPEQLPNLLQKFLDDAKGGAIYFSMGTYFQSEKFSNENKQMFLNIFRKLNMRVIWKFDGDVHLPNKPPNVLTKNWLPQRDILAHPNVKLFITNGGYGSVQETVYHGVPALMIPILSDQFTNAYHAQEQGYALKINYKDKNINEETLYALIKELLENPKYSENAKAISKLFRDRPMKPLDTAVYWIDYTIRNKGADHLKVAAVKLPLYQLYMLDVVLFLVVVFFVVIFGLWFCVKRSFRKEVPKKVKKK